MTHTSGFSVVPPRASALFRAEIAVWNGFRCNSGPTACAGAIPLHPLHCDAMASTTSSENRTTPLRCMCKSFTQQHQRSRTRKDTAKILISVARPIGTFEARSSSGRKGRVTPAAPCALPAENSEASACHQACNACFNARISDGHGRLTRCGFFSCGKWPRLARSALVRSGCCGCRRTRSASATYASSRTSTMERPRTNMCICKCVGEIAERAVGWWWFCGICWVVAGLRRLSDSLVSSNGIISSKLAGKLRFLDSTYVAY